MHHQDRKKYSREFKLEAVNTAQHSEKPIAQVARELDISVHQLYRWISEVSKKKDNPFPGHGKRDSQDELARLRKENQILKEERDILKKSLGFFAKDQYENTNLSDNTK